LHAISDCERGRSSDVHFRVGKDSSPAASLHIRPKEPKKFVTPSPGAYNPENADKEVKASSAKYSFGIKSDVKNVSDSPGKNSSWNKDYFYKNKG
jgi:hypothetical protein